MPNYYPARRHVAYVSSLGTSQLHLRSPHVIAFWSAMFPGLGHLLLGKYLRGFFMFFWEIIANYQAHLNLAIFVSFTGNFALAKEILDTRWMLLYIPAFLFAIRDSYRSAVDLNNQYQLAVQEDAAIGPFAIDVIEINYLDKRDPWAAVAWSLLMPGLGQLSIHRIVVAIFIFAWWTILVYFANLLPAIHNTLLGNFGMAQNILNIQWALNIPSILLFAAYDSYVNTVESNKLFDWEQARFFNRRYQPGAFKMPLNQNKGSEMMYVISTFQHSIWLEKAITAIERKGIAKDHILAVPMDKRDEEAQIFDSMNQSDGLPVMDLPFMLATVLAILGGIYGFNLTWGPIIWGLIGMGAGFGIGLIIRLQLTKKYLAHRSDRIGAEVVLMINCKPDQTEAVRNILWDHHAMGVRKLILGQGE